VIGLVVLILFAGADILGIGENPTSFGSVQIGGSIIGTILILIGLVLFLKKE
jgi:hypothetical protein